MAPKTETKTPDEVFERGDLVDLKGVPLEVRHVTEHEVILVPVKAVAKKAA